MADFTWVPNYVLPQSTEYSTVVSEGENGKERRRSKRTNGRKSFRLSFQRLTLTDADALWAFFEAKKGQNSTFTWTNPIKEGGVNVTYTVRFDADRCTREYFTYGRYRIEIGFIVV